MNGKRITQKKFHTKKSAKEWEIKERKKIGEQTLMGSLHEAATEYLNWCQNRFTNGVYQDKRRVLKELINNVGNIPLYHIKPKIIMKFLQGKSTKNLFNRTRKDLHAFFNYCIKFHGLKKNPVSEIDKMPVDRHPQPVPTEKEFIKLLMAADRHDRNLIIACATTGGRRSEVFRLTWHDDINFEKRSVRLGTRKTRSGEMKYRLVHMNEMLFEALQDQVEDTSPTQ